MFHELQSLSFREIVFSMKTVQTGLCEHSSPLHIRSRLVGVKVTRLSVTGLAWLDV